MAWNNQGGPWGGGGQGGSGGGGSPWSRGPGGGPPDFEEMLRRGQDRVRNLVPGGLGPGRVGALIATVAIALWALSGLYIVQPGERGVPMLFGQFFGPPTDPGLHWNWPTPIGSVLTPNVETPNQVEIGFRGSQSTAGNREVDEESLMLTGDENIVQVEAVVLWRINDVEKYLFEIRDPAELTNPGVIKNESVKNAVEAAIRETIGQSTFEYTITEGRQDIGQKAQELAQHILDSYNSGIRIEELSLQRVDAPNDVIEAFRDVQKARADKVTTINEAQAYFNQVTQDAEGQAAQIVRQAEAYMAEKVANAQGDTQRFLSIYEQYKANPAVTSRRLYLETIERILAGMDKILIDPKDGSGAVPYLPLDQLLKHAPAAQEQQGGQQ
jgi:membrane protease subunit HflK